MVFAFEDMGSLLDAMDKKMELFSFKRALDSNMANLKPTLSTTCVARNPEFWQTQLKCHLETGSSREFVVDSFSLLF